MVEVSATVAAVIYRLGHTNRHRFSWEYQVKLSARELDHRLGPEVQRLGGDMSMCLYHLHLRKYCNSVQDYKFDLEYEKVREVRSPLFSFRSSKTNEEEVRGQIGVELEVHHAAEPLNSPLVVFIRALAD